MAPPKIPIEARQEIYTLLSEQLQVKASEVNAVLKKYGITGDVERLQERYRRQLAQSLMSALRDEQGRREVFAVVNAQGEVLYVPIECCNNRAELKQIRQRMRRQMKLKIQENVVCDIFLATVSPWQKAIRLSDFSVTTITTSAFVRL